MAALRPLRPGAPDADTKHMTRLPRVRRWLSTSAAAAVLALSLPAALPSSGAGAGRPVEALGPEGAEGHAELIAEPRSGPPRPVVARSLRNDTSGPLRAMASAPPRVANAGGAPVATFAGVRTGDLKLTVKTSRRPVKIEGLGVGR